MRALIVIAASIAGLVAGAAAASAAELPLAPPEYDDCCATYGPGAPLVMLDDEPGVVIRRWWLPPWDNRHYYPRGRSALKTGVRTRVERGRPRRARSFARYWTNPPVYVIDPAPLLMPEFELPPWRVRRYPPPAGAAP